MGQDEILIGDSAGPFPDSSEKERVMNELARCYADRRVTVIKQIFSPRSDPVRSFADAFNLRRK